MSEPRHLRNAPITEALFDFRLESQVKLTDESFVEARAALSDRYPDAEVKQKIEGTVKLENGKVVADTQRVGVKGLFARSSDGLTIVQFRADGFTLNRLRPYTSWDELFPEAMRLWHLYSGLAGAPSVARLALRYINHVQLALREGDNFSVCLEMPPNVPDPLPQTVSSFLMRFTIHDTDVKIDGNIVQALEPPVSGQAPTMVLDIDVFKVLIPPEKDDTEISEVFRSLHEMKNRVFFNLLTDQCLQPYQ